MTAAPRWDGDRRGSGVASGAWIAAEVAQLGAALAAPDWIAESAEDHLLQPIQRAGAEPGSAWRLTRTMTRGEVFEIELHWAGPVPNVRHLRAEVFSLIGRLAEGTTYVHQIFAEGTLEFHVTTGSVGTDTSFTPHGHLIRIIVTAPQLTTVLAGPHRNASGNR
jgi:hypothetical protein